MIIEQNHTILSSKQKLNILVMACILLLSLITVVADLFFSRWQGTSFFLSESLLFSTFWLLFFPILNIQLKLIRYTKSPGSYLLFTAAATGIHLLAYPALIWLVSHSFYNHTFRYWQTAKFGLTEHTVKALIIYSISYPVHLIYKSGCRKKPGSIEKVEDPAPTYLTSILVADTNNKKVSIAVSDILYFSANPPYVNIHHPAKKYLHTGTLKSLEVKLQAQSFVRIHKSFLVNIGSVVSYQSRLNGDYDVALVDGTALRVSRNYAAAFKSFFHKHHRVNVK